MGLYPFNGDSLVNMLRRLNDNHDRKFNPRLLVKDVMAEILGTYGEDLKEGRFPPKQLLDQMRGAQLPPVVQDRLRQEHPQQADRQLAILELWGNGGSQTSGPGRGPVHGLWGPPSRCRSNSSVLNFP